MFCNCCCCYYHLKVAIVNLDKGEDDQNQGNELVQSLIDSGTIKICTVSEDEAQDGLVNGRYYAKITIPEDFTKSLNNAENADREKTVITYSPNKKSNYLAYQIINNVVIKNAIIYNNINWTLEIILEWNCVIIKDSWIWISQQNLDKIWERFYTNSRKQYLWWWIGLWLSIVKKIIDINSDISIVEDKDTCYSLSIVLFNKILN